MAYNWDKTKPAGTQPGNDIDDAIRDTRAGVEAMLGTEHVVDVSNPTAVTAKHSTMIGPITISPTSVSGVQNALILQDNSSGASEGAQIAFRVADHIGVDLATIGLSSEIVGGSLIFKTNPADSGQPVERMRITPSGSVVIGDVVVQQLVPPGAVMAFARATPPPGWLECNGQVVSRTTYAALFAAIGTTFGTGDGSTTFNLPDLRGEFIRGWDHGRGVDPGRTLGSRQADITKGIDTGLVTRRDHRDWSDGGYGDWFFGFLGGSGAFTWPTGGPETRPRNVALMYCIKY